MWICWRQKDGQSHRTMRGAADRYARAVRITESMRCPPGLGEVCSILATSLQSPRTRWAVRGPDLVLVLGRARARGNLGDRSRIGENSCSVIDLVERPVGEADEV